MDDLERLRDHLDRLSERRVPEHVDKGALLMAFRCISETKETALHLGDMVLEMRERLQRSEPPRARRTPVEMVADTEEAKFIRQAAMTWKIFRAVGKAVATLLIGAAFLLGFLEGIFDLSNKLGAGG